MSLEPGRQQKTPGIPGCLCHSKVKYWVRIECAALLSYESGALTGNRTPIWALRGPRPNR